MKKDLLKLIVTVALTTLIVGCGSSGSSSSNTSNANGANGANGTDGADGADGNTINPRTCTYNITNPYTSIKVGDDYNASAITATATKGGGGVAAAPTSTGADAVDPATAGTYPITFTSTDCDNEGKTKVIVKEAEGVKDSSNPLPF